MPENRIRKYMVPDGSISSQKHANLSIINTNTTNINVVNINYGPSEGRQSTTMGVLTEYIQAAMQKTVMEQLEDGSWYANIPPCPGVWANEITIEQCKVILREVLEEWLLLKLRDNDPLEEINGISLRVVQEPCGQ